MRHRVFVAINPYTKGLPSGVVVNPDEQIITKIGKVVDECRKKLPRGITDQMRFAPSENWHITLSFLGHQEEAGIENIKTAIKETVKMYTSTSSRSSIFEVRLEKIIWGPPGTSPRMIWILGDKDTSRRLGEIKNRLEDALEAKKVLFDRETRPFNAHITLARFDLKLSQPKPTIEKDVDLQFEATSLDLMESKLSRGGAEYTIIQKFPLISL